MIDSVIGPVRINNLLSTLNIKPISNKNLKCMERRAGSEIEKVASKSTCQAAADAFHKEMEDVRHNGSFESEKNMDGFIGDIGVCPMPDTSPSFKSRILSKSTIENDDEWTDDEMIMDQTLLRAVFYQALQEIVTLHREMPDI